MGRNKWRPLGQPAEWISGVIGHEKYATRHTVGDNTLFNNDLSTGYFQ